MSYLERLELLNYEKQPPKELQKVQKEPSYSSCSSKDSHSQLISVEELIYLMKLGGYRVSVIDGQLDVQESHWIDDEMEDLLRIHRLKLIEYFA